MQQLERVALAEPSFILEDFFVGQTTAFGMFMDRFGNVRRQFHVQIEGRIEDGSLILDEDFSFSDGELSRRTWKITPRGHGRYEGTADDVVGKAEGRITGNCLRWAYDLDLMIDQRMWRVGMDEVMLLESDQMLVNRSAMKKFGVTIGEVIIVFRKEPSQSSETHSDTAENQIRTGSSMKKDHAPLATVSM